MSFLKTVDEESADGDVAAIYERDVKRQGYLPKLQPDLLTPPRGLTSWNRSCVTH